MLKVLKYTIYSLLGKRYKEYIFKFRSILYSCHFIQRMNFRPAQKKNIFYFVFDSEYNHHPGLADRLKAVLGCYYIAKNNGYDFKIVDQTNSGLGKYLVCNKNYLAFPEDLEFSCTDTKFLNYSTLLCGIECKLMRNKQYHCHCYLGDDLFYQNGKEYKQPYRQLFNELFSPTDEIKLLLEQTKLETRKYISVHARFVNLLGNFEDSKYPTLSPQKQEDLIQRCLLALENICKENSLPVVMFSDSRVFLERAKELPVVVLNTEGISHISLVNSDMSQAKTYLDFLLIKQSAKLYRFMSNELHPTGFSIYASFAGGIECIDTNV